MYRERPLLRKPSDTLYKDTLELNSEHNKVTVYRERTVIA